MTDYLIIASLVDSVGWMDLYYEEVIDPRIIVMKAPTEEIIEYCLEAKDEDDARSWFESIADSVGWDYEILDVEEA